MKTYTPEALAAIEAGEAIFAAAVEILCDDPVRVWSGHQTIQIGGEDFLPIADRGLARVQGGALGSAASNVELELSGIDAETMALLDRDAVRRAPATLWRLIWSGDGRTLLDIEVYKRGRVDLMTEIETIGGTAAILLALETAARGLGRRGGRMRTDADQRLIKPDDGFFRHVSYAAEISLYWGGPKPATAGQALGGSKTLWFPT